MDLRPGAALGIVLAATLAGCSSIWPTTHSTMFPATSETGTVALAEQPVDVIDLTGLVSGVAVPADMEVDGFDGPRADVDGSRVTLAWLGGACESRTRIVFGRRDDAYAIRLKSDSSLGGMIGCPAIGIHRFLVVTLKESIEGRQLSFLPAT